MIGAIVAPVSDAALRRFFLTSYVAGALVLTTLFGMALLGPRPSGFFATVRRGRRPCSRITLYAGLHLRSLSDQPPRADRRRRPGAPLLGSARRHARRGMSTASHHYAYSRRRHRTRKSRRRSSPSSKHRASTVTWERYDAGVLAAREARHAPARRAPRIRPPQQSGAQGTRHDARRRRLYERQRRLAEGARPVRQPSAGRRICRMSDRASSTSTSSSCARTPRTCTRASSTKSCREWSRA